MADHSQSQVNDPILQTQNFTKNNHNQIEWTKHHIPQIINTILKRKKCTKMERAYPIRINSQDYNFLWNQMEQNRINK